MAIDTGNGINDVFAHAVEVPVEGKRGFWSISEGEGSGCLNERTGFASGGIAWRGAGSFHCIRKLCFGQ